MQSRKPFTVHLDHLDLALAVCMIHLDLDYYVIYVSNMQYYRAKSFGHASAYNNDEVDTLVPTQEFRILLKLPSSSLVYLDFEKKKN